MSQAVEAAEQANQLANKDSQTYGAVIQVEDLTARANICKSKIEALLEREKVAQEERDAILGELDKKLLEEKTAFTETIQQEITKATQDFNESEQLLSKKYSYQ